MNTSQFSQVFPLGSHLCREPMPAMGELKRDMALLKRQGFNLIKLQEHWMTDEPVEGRFQFERYEELIEHAARLNLGVYLGLTCEQAPGWLTRKHPDCRMEARQGQRVMYEAPTTLPGDGKPGPCYDHPGAMEAQQRFITRLVGTLGRFENIVVWNTWQEIAYSFDGCFCPNTLAAFRHWLNERMGDLDALNRAWNTRYGDWMDIIPSRELGKRLACAVDIHWQYFMDNIQIGNVLRARADAIRAADPLKRPVFAHKGGPIIGSGADWTYARCQDFLGSSSYPAWRSFHAWEDGSPTGKQPQRNRHGALLAELCNEIVLKYDYIRSANRRGAPVWAAEFQGGPVSTAFHKGRVPAPEDIRRWMLGAVSAGVSGISFWVARAEIMAQEQNGFSLLDSEGETTPRLEEAGRIGRALNANADVLGRPTWPAPEVAVLVNEWNYQFCMAMGQGGDQEPFSYRGWHRLLWEANVPMDFIEAMELDEPYIRNYKAIVVPFPLAMSEDVAARLARYAGQGGHLICEAAPGRMSEAAFCNRGELSPCLRDLFGVRQTGFTLVREPEDGLRWSPGERTWGEYLEAAMLEGVGPLAGQALRANGYIQTFECRGGEPVLKHGEAVAGVVRETGRGRAWLLGTFVGHNGLAYRDARTRAAVSALLARAGVRPAHDGRLILRKRVTPDREAWLFTNPTAGAVTESVSVSGWPVVSDLLGAPVTRAADRVSLTVESLDIRALLVSR